MNAAHVAASLTRLALLACAAACQSSASPPSPPSPPPALRDVSAPLEVSEPPRVPAPPAAPTPPRPAALAAHEEPASDLEQLYLGVHALGVNRVSDARRPGKVAITKRDGNLELDGQAAEGPYSLRIQGVLQPVSAKQFVVEGELTGVPNMAWAGEAPRQRHTRGRFTFEATKGRKFWRLYAVDGVDCVCNDHCGNDFCYIDIDFSTL